MHTIVATDHKREQQFVLDSTEYVHTLRVNGDRIVTFTISESENNAEVLQLIDKRWSILIYEGNKFEEYVVQNIYEETREGLLIVEVDTLYRDYDNLKREVLNETYTGSKTMEEWFKYAFKASKYKVVVNAEFQKARNIENFGYDHTLGLLLRLCNTYNVEFYISGDTVFIVDELGEYKDDYVEYGINLQELSRDRVMEGFGTTVKMFGMDKTDKDGEVIGRWEVEYENKDLVREYGKIPLPTIYDERFNDIDAMMAECEQRVKDSMNISLNVVVDDLEFKDDDVSVYEGDYIRIYDDRIGFDSVIRIVEMCITRNHLGDILKREYIIGDYDEEYADYIKEQQRQENIRDYINQIGNKLGLDMDEIWDGINDVNKGVKDLEEWTKEKIDETIDELQSVKLQAGSSAKIYRQATEPKGTKDVPLADGDLWYKTRWLGGQSQVGVEMYQYQMEGNTGRWHRVEDIEMGNADRLEKGTINAKVINLINLNANEIVTGTIRGQNLNINLDKGTVEFTKGKIYKSDGTFDIDVDDGSIYSMSENDDKGFRISRGEISLRRKSTIGSGFATVEIGKITRSSKVFNDLRASMLIESDKSMVLQTKNFKDTSLTNDRRYGSAIYIKDMNTGNMWSASEGESSPQYSPKYAVHGIDMITTTGIGQTIGSPKYSLLNPGKYVSSYSSITKNKYLMRIGEDNMKPGCMVEMTSPQLVYGSDKAPSRGFMIFKTNKVKPMYVSRSPNQIPEGEQPTLDEKHNAIAKDAPEVSPSIWIDSGHDLLLEARNRFDITSRGRFEVFHQGDAKFSFYNKSRATVMFKKELSITSPLTYILGDLQVTGKKNAIHVTRDGFRETPAYETAIAYIGDIGEITTDDDGKCVVKISDPMYDISNTDINYQVFLSAYDNCDYWVSDRNPREFTINTDKPNCNIAYEIKAKRRGYEDEYFKRVDHSQDEFVNILEEMR